jgi:hypothetical protein
VATLTEVLGARPLQQSNITQDLSTGIQTGIQLATAKEQVEQKKVLVEQQKEELNAKKFQSFVGSLQTYIRSSPTIRKKMRPRIEDNLRSRDIPADSLIFDEIDNDPKYENDLRAVLQSIATGEMPIDPAKAMQTAQDAGLVREFVESTQMGKKLNSQAEIAAMKNETALAKMETAAAKAEGAVERGNEKIKFTAREKVKNDFDKAVKDDLGAYEAAGEAEGLLASGGTIADAAARSKVARIFEKGVLTDSDLSRLGGGKSLYDRGLQLVSDLSSGNLTEKNRAELFRITRTLRPLILEKIEDKRKYEAETGAKVYKGFISREELYDMLNLGEKFAVPKKGEAAAPAAAATPAAPAAAPGAPVPPPNYQALEAQLRALKNPDNSPRYNEAKIQEIMANAKAKKVGP